MDISKPPLAARRQLHVVTDSDAFILTASANEKKVDTPDLQGREFKLTITIHWEEYRQPSQPAGTLWLQYQLGKTTPALPGIESVVPIVLPTPPENITFVIVTRGNVLVHYTGQANAHVWLSFYAEYLA